MKSLQESITEVCRELSAAATQLQLNGECFLSSFDTETALGLAISDEQAKAYQQAFDTFLFSLLRNLDGTDEIGARLSTLVALAERPENESIEHAIYQKWNLYERYRRMIIQYLENTKPYVARKVAWKEVSYTPLLKHTRDLLQNIHAYAEEFVLDLESPAEQSPS